MFCLCPKRIKNPYSHEVLVVSCGHCLPCRLKKRQEWTLRLQHEKEYWRKSCFLTLTYNDGCLPSVYLQKPDLTGFFKDLRNKMRTVCPGRQIKYFACGEYGGRFHRPHFHAIVFGLSINEMKAVCPTVWNNGFICVENVCPETIRYVAGYVCDKLTPKRMLEKFKDSPPFQLQSQGLGARWAFDHKKIIEKCRCIPSGKYQSSIPRYYLRKLFPKDDPDNLWFYDELKACSLERMKEFCRVNGIDEKYVEHSNWYDPDENPYYMQMVSSSMAKVFNMLCKMNLRREYKEKLNFQDFVDNPVFIARVNEYQSAYDMYHDARKAVGLPVACRRYDDTIFRAA